uniref:TMEM205-like domain-containing protein n=1 Tax=Strigamia maritima TaxID=126957 RepID=T1IS77_STRMM
MTTTFTMQQCREELLKNASGEQKIRITSFSSFFKVNQPAHLVVLLFVVYFWSIITNDSPKDLSSSPFLNLIYLASFAFHFGAQIWMTFVSGIILFLTVPRHTFGLVQEQLFPRYFLLNTALSFITVNTFLQRINIWAEQTQMVLLCVCFFSELITWLYLVPPILSILQGTGGEDSKRANQCPLHGPLKKCFKRLHNVAAVANIIAIACNTLHLYHLANQLSTIAK